MEKSFLRVILCVSFVVGLIDCAAPRGFAEEVDPQQQIWDETRSLLQRREYSLAINLLENGLEDSDFFRFTSRLQQDLDAVKRLQKLFETVEYAAVNLTRPTPLKVLSKELRFDRRTNEAPGTSLIFTNASGGEVTYPLVRLDSATWLQLAEPELRTWPDKEFVTGVFLAFDRYPDSRLARAQLNAAAEAGKDVAVWIERLEDAERERKQKGRPGGTEPSANELLLGKWSVAVKDGPRIVWEFRRGGDGIVMFKGRRQRATWEQESSGVFRFSNTSGNTAVINVAGDRIFGRFANGRPFRGVRQAE